MSESETETSEQDAAPDDGATNDRDGDGEDEGHGTRYPGADPEDEEEIEEERKRRLDPDNRPDNAEVDNTDRDFDAKKGRFTDADDYDQAEEKFPDIGEQGA
jgi:hypothetical protein